MKLIKYYYYNIVDFSQIHILINTIKEMELRYIKSEVYLLYGVTGHLNNAKYSLQQLQSYYTV